MARRDRVPRHKSHNQRKNKNPKLSPFQRELKRNKLANQAPTAKSMGTEKDIPKSERLVFEFLQKRKERQEEKRRLLKEQREAEEREAQEAAQAAAEDADEDDELDDSQSNASSEGASSSEEGRSAPDDSDEEIPDEPASEEGESSEDDEEKDEDDSDDDDDDTAPAAKRVKTDPAASAHTSATQAATMSKKQLKKARGFAHVPSLNEELTSEMGKAVQAFRARPLPSDATTGKKDDDPNRPRTVDEIIAKKKERKHKRKMEARRERVSEKYVALERELQDMLKKGTGKKAKKNNGESPEEFNAAFEKKLKEMQAEKRREDERLKKLEKQRKLHGVSEEATGSRAGGSSASHGRKATRQASDLDGVGERVESANDGASSSTAGTKKSISFGDDVDPIGHHVMRYPGDRGDAQGSSGPSQATSSTMEHQKKRPRDFYELVDVVRYGERVEAPPVFDVVPNKNAAVTRLARKLEREEAAVKPAVPPGRNTTARGAPRDLVGVRPAHLLSGSHANLVNAKGKQAPANSADERYRLLSSAGGIGEQKRLARLGLAPAITAPINLSGRSGHTGDDAGGANSKKQKEMEMLRDRVMATYRQNKRHHVEQKKGVDMKHQFPRFS